MTTSTSSTSSTSATTAPVSIAGSSSAQAAGGSVINVSSLVSQLVAATRAPQDALIAAQTQAVTTQISAHRHAQRRAVDVPVIARRARYAERVQCADREQYRADGVHGDRELGRSGRHLQRVGHVAGTGAAAAVESVHRWCQCGGGHRHAAALARRHQLQRHHRRYRQYPGGHRRGHQWCGRQSRDRRNGADRYRRRPPGAVIVADRRRQYDSGHRDRCRQWPGRPDLRHRQCRQLHAGSATAGCSLQHLRCRLHQPQQHRQQRAGRRDADAAGAD